MRGCAQTQGIYYYETYSPVVRYTTIRYLLALAAKENLEISHMDVTAAYLNSDLGYLCKTTRRIQKYTTQRQNMETKESCIQLETEWKILAQKVR